MIAKQMKCGGCGNDSFHFYEGEKDPARAPTLFALKCTKCGSKTAITPKVSLEIKWDANASGCPAVFKDSTDKDIELELQ